MNLQHQKKYKVALLGTLPPLRGISSYCFELSRAISELCYIDFLSFKYLYPSFLYPGQDLKKDITYPTVNTERLSVKAWLTWYNPLTWIVTGLMTKAKLLHAQWWSLPLLPIYTIICLAFKLKKKPVVFTVHNVLPHERANLYLPLTRLLFKLVDHFIVHTADNAEQLNRYYHIPKDCITQIAHGTLDFHIKKQTNKSVHRKEMSIEDHHKVILFFGAIRPYKGLDTLLTAFTKVIKQCPDARLVIAGKLWEKTNRYTALITTLKITDYVIPFFEYIPSGDVHKFFSSADLVVLPYHRFNSQSGVGTTTIAFRKPLIVTRVGGLPDLVSNDRYILPPADAEMLANAMINCLDDPNQLGAMASSADKIAENLSWSTIAKKTCEVYHTLLFPYKIG